MPYPNHVKDNLISLITIYDMPAETKVTVFQTVCCIPYGGETVLKHGPHLSNLN